MPNASDLDSGVVAIGQLIGLVTGTGDNISIDTAWFSDPLTPLEQIGTRLDTLVTLVDALLGPGLTNPPDVFTDAQWYPIPNPYLGSLTPFHLVTAGDADTSGQLGVGVLRSLQLGSLTIDCFLYVPLCSYSPACAQFIAGSAPCQLGLYFTASDTFQVNGVSFTAMKIDAGIYLADQAPTFTLTFENLTGTSAPSTYSTLSDLLNTDVEAWMGEVVVQGSTWLNLYVDASHTVGAILVAANFLTQDKDGNYHLSLSNLQGQTCAQIALNFVFAALDALASLDIPLITLPGGGIYIVNRVNTNGSTDYGVRVAIDMPLTSGSQNANGQASPAVNLCLGAWMTAETDTDNWIQEITGAPVPPGLSVFLLNKNGATLTFAPSFEMVSIGIDIKGGGDGPLINLNGYTLGGAEIRGFLNSTDWSYGFAARLDNVGFPLGMGFTSAQQGGASTNPVASTLLASDDQNTNTDDKSAVNPAFSAKAGYIPGYDPLFEILDPQGNQTDIIWFPIQGRFGPINCKQIGLKIDVTGANQNNPILGIVFDGDVSLAALDVYLDQLAINVPLKTIADISSYGLDLQGLDVAFNGGGVAISGGLLKLTDSQGNISYDGEALIKAETLSISALGAYSSLPNNGGTSMFIFAMLNYPLGGPSFFFVTGLAAGFGYNRALKIPAQNDVQSFPLVAGLSNTAIIGGNNPSPGDVLASLETWVPPQRGEYWLAAGVQFTTFEIINTNALLIVEFGNDFTIAVLGISTLKQPQIGDAYVYAELDLELVFQPTQGVLQASAVLSSNSYVLTPDAHLTGGFAFYAWFGDNAHAGDFVFTVGGYYPGFKVPSYYPQEPQLGINWKVSDTISIVGGAYFAITPAAMMAGGGLQVTFASGPLKAWLKAQIDVILFWKPFYLLATASISIGVSYRISFLGLDKTISVEISANFSLWGPPIGGTAHVDWYIISFTIGFGPGPAGPPQLTWDEFKGLLPSKTTQQGSPQALAQRPRRRRHHTTQPLAAAPADTTTTPAYLHINAQQGLLRTQVIANLTLWLVRADQFQVSIGSALPASTILVESETAANNKTITGLPVAIRGVNGGISSQDYQCTQTIGILQLQVDTVAAIQACMATTSPCTIQPTGNCTGTLIDISGWEVDPLLSNLPAALWGDPVPAGQTPPINTAQIVQGTIGVTLEPLAPVLTNCTPEMVISTVFEDRTVNPTNAYQLPLAQTQPPVNTPPQPADSFADIANVNTATTVQSRDLLFLALQGLGINGWTNAPLPLMAADPSLDFADEPMEGAPA